MPQSPDWKRVLETGMQFTELRRSQAHRLAADLVAQGQLARDQVGAAVDELIEISRNRSEELRTLISSEVQRQLGVLGLATKNDLTALERRLRSAAKPAPAKKAPATKPAARKPAARKAPAKAAAKPAAAQQALAKKAAAKKAATKQPPAKKSAAKKAAVKKSPARKQLARKRPAGKRVVKQTTTKRAR